ncbi:MAG: cation-translocating P-type ATPase [Sandaracinaceae bacterium]|nr:cation-translocating P-type ATPase [Sandaracinaceae bacterium]
MELERPTLPEKPCPVCGKPVEPLRAREVLLLEDGFRFLCDAECRARFAEGERDHEASRSSPRVVAPIRKRAPTPAPPMPRRLASADRSAAYRALGAPEEPLPWVGLGAAMLGLLLGAFATHPAVAVVSAACVGVASAYALMRGWPTRREVGWLGWGMPSAGAVLAAIGALLARSPHDDARLWLVGAAIASGTVVLRAWLDARATRPVEEMVRLLAEKMPAAARVPQPSDEWSTEVAWDEVAAVRVRAGQEILAAEGEVVAVDGVVRAGEAYALLHPASQTPVRRVPGDPVLAGAFVTEGALRILATRVGDERALVRPRGFGKLHPGRTAALTRLVARLGPWGGLALVAGAAASALFAVSGGIATQLATAAAVLLAAPLLAIRRCSEAPYVAAGATAAERGIAFSSARALDRAGRTSVAAFCSHGVITEGEPEVVEIHSIGDAPWEPLVALAAGAEAAASHPIARAVIRFCERRRITPSVVRRAEFAPGRGVTAVTPSGEALVVGNRALLLEQGVSVAMADADAARAEERGHTVVFVGLDGRARAVISLRDEDRLGARAAVQRLMDLSIEVVLISGDHRGTVEALARTLDITHVKAELLPAECGATVTHLRETGGLVAAVGRPGYDDAALDAADVPVVLGAAGAVDGERGVASTGDDPRDAAAALWLARAARRAAWRGALVAAVGGGALLVLAATGIAVPAIAALVALGIDAYALPSASRLLRRIELRLPAQG